jgi:ubiquinone/menaquinone biosynthesis C-methylase UbiE
VSAPGADVGAWEAAYQRFESAEEETAKFTERVIKLGAQGWPRDAHIAEIFCGRGNGLRALGQLGFHRLEGVDLSPRLLLHCPPEFKCHEADCRQLPFADASLDIVIVQGGLHHLAMLPDDLERVLAEAARVLQADGRIVIVEPWLTPFLWFVHGLCHLRIARRLSRKIDALAVMIEHERATYERWLAQPELILGLLHRVFREDHCSFSRGKFWFTGRKRNS